MLIQFSWLYLLIDSSVIEIKLPSTNLTLIDGHRRRLLLLLYRRNISSISLLGGCLALGGQFEDVFLAELI
jgi:hypothetical protein